MPSGLLLLHVGGDGQSFTPTSVTSATIIGWYQSSSLVLSDGAAVSLWGDSSGKGHDQSQSTGGRQPLYKVNRINGLATVLFDGVDDWMQTAFSQSQPVHIFAVLNVIQNASANVRLFDGGTITNAMAVYLPNANSLGVAMFAGAFGPSVTMPSGPSILRISFNGGSSKIGTGTSAYNTGSAGTTDPGGMTLAANAVGGSNSNTEYGEVIFYAGTLSAGDETALLGYLKAKWGL